jgi:tRNA-modifying protein YgfZ
MDELTTRNAALEWSVVRAEGPDAKTFLQSQLSQDLEGLDEAGRWTLLLRPDGVVVTAATIAPDDGGYALTVPRELGEATLARLRRFLLRTECTLSLADADEGPYVDEIGLINDAWPHTREFAAGLAPQSFGSAFVERSVSFTKGCYTGQELVTRLHSRGSNVPWRLVRASGPSASRIDDALRSQGPEGPKGVTTAVEVAEVTRVLGIAHRTLRADALSDVRVEVLA